MAQLPVPPTEARCVAEFVGTFVLVFTVGCTVLTGNAVWGGASVGGGLMIATYALAGVSGANFNPAVSVALAVSRAMGGPGVDMKAVGMYSVVQVAAGFCASLGYASLFGDGFALGPSRGFGWFHVGLCEALYTGLLCFVVLSVAVAKNNQPNQFYGLAIGLIFVAGMYAAGPVSGGCFNPAIAVGIDATSGAGIGLRCLAYVAFEVAGAVLAAVLFSVVRPEDFGGRARGPVAELASEFLGTFAVVFTAGLNILGKSPAASVSVAASLVSMTYALHSVSGAHFNPAVTLAVLASGRVEDFGVPKAGFYLAAQLSGGLLAAEAYSGVQRGASFALKPGVGFTVADVVAAEGLFSFLWCYVFLCVAVSRTTKSSVMFGLAIGACLLAGGSAVGVVSGGFLNPAASLGMAAGHRFAGSALQEAVMYSLIELAGGLTAAAAFRATHQVDTEEGIRKDIPVGF